MDRIDGISALPVEVLAHILKFVPNKEHLFTVSKKFYNAACIASTSNYRFTVNANFKRCFENIIRSKRVFHDFNIDLINMNDMSKDNVKKFAKVVEKFGGGVRTLKITFDCVAEEDIRTLLRFFPNVKTLSIRQTGKFSGTVPRISLKQEIMPTTLASLNSIYFGSKLLQFNKVFHNVRLTNNFKKLNVHIQDIADCFELIKQTPSIKELKLSTPKFVSSIPIDHLKLKTVSVEMPRAKSLVSCLERQTDLENFDLENYINFLFKDSDDDDSDVSLNSEHELDTDLLVSATKMSSLSNLNVCIDGMEDGDFVHFSKLSQLQQLSVRSGNLDKIRMFGNVVLTNVKRLLLFFTHVDVPNSDIVRIATNFSNVSDLVYDGEYFCDAFIYFAGNLQLLEKLKIMRSHDYLGDSEQFSSRDGANVKANHSLKSISLNFGFPDERNVHNFMIRVAVTAPNVENLCIEIDSMKIEPNNFSYILRNFKKLKNINLSYDLHPYDRWLGIPVTSMSDVKEFGRRMELKIIDILKEHGTQLEYVQLSLSSSHDLRVNLWEQAFSKQFASIKVDDLYVTMKKDVNAEEWKIFP